MDPETPANANEETQQAVPAGAETAEPGTDELTLEDWKAQSRKHEDRAKRLSAQVDSLKSRVTALEAEQERADAAEAELAELRVDLADKERLILAEQVAREKGVPADRIRGDTREEMEVDADDLARLLTAAHRPAGGAGIVTAAGTGNPDTEVADVEAARKRARDYIGAQSTFKKG